MKELTSGLFQRCPIPLNFFQGAFSEVKNTSRRHVIEETGKTKKTLYFLPSKLFIAQSYVS